MPIAAWRAAVKREPQEPAEYALGRSCGGFSTKIDILCDRRGHTLDVRLSPGQTHESGELEALLESVDWDDLAEEPLACSARLAGDKAYRADWIDDWLMERGVEPVIPSKAGQDPDARLVEFDRDACRDRNIVERLIGWLKESRRVLTRFEKTATNCIAMVKWACVKCYLRLMAVA